jgi:hypothetical protein
MALGVLYGRKSSADSHKKVYALSERLVRDFEKQFGSRNCSDLLGCEISTPVGQAVFEADKLVKTVCQDITVKTTELVMQVLECIAISTIYWPPARRAYASDRITVFFTTIFLLSRME